MFQELLSYVNARYQYEIQKRSGGFGLVLAIAIIITLATWPKWGQPISDFLGITEFARAANIIQDNPVNTFIVLFILFVIVLLCIFLILYIFPIISLLMLIIPKPILFILGLPFFILYGIVDGFKKTVVELIEKYKPKKAEVKVEETNQWLFPEYLEYLKDEENYVDTPAYRSGRLYLSQHAFQYYTREEAIQELKKYSPYKYEEHKYLVGYNKKEDTWVIIGKQPLPNKIDEAVRRKLPLQSTIEMLGGLNNESIYKVPTINCKAWESGGYISVRVDKKIGQSVYGEEFKFTDINDLESIAFCNHETLYMKFLQEVEQFMGLVEDTHTIYEALMEESNGKLGTV